MIDYTENRGKIQFRERARQIVDFSNLRYGNITPTDIDGLIEYKDKAVIFIELKYLDAEMPNGQRIAFERIVDDVDNAGKYCALLLCSHCVQDCTDDIDASAALVKRAYYKGRWIDISEPITLRKQIDRFITYINTKPFKGR